MAVFEETEKIPKSLWINIFQSVFHLFLAGGLAWHSVVTPLNHTGSSAQPSPCSHIYLTLFTLYFTTQFTSDIELSVCFQLPSPIMVDEYPLDLLYSVEFT